VNACLTLLYTYTLTDEVMMMATILFLLVVLVFCFGVLIGSVLHTQAVDRLHRRVTRRVQELHDLEELLVEREETLAGVSDLPAIPQESQLGTSRVEVAR
jgi:hypothetical protein